MFYIISYDIPDDGRRNKLAKALKGYGSRVQYSVFEAHLNKTEFKELKREVGNIIDSSEDSVRCYALCNTCVKRIEVYTTDKVTEKPDTIIV